MILLWANCFHEKVFFPLGAQRRCYDCRSRGDKGVCKDPFIYNVTTYLKESSIEARPCASGWCGKIIEGTSSTFKQDGEFKHKMFYLI